MIFQLLYFSLEIFNMGIFDFLKRKDPRENEMTGKVPPDRGLPRPTVTPPMPPVRSPSRPQTPARHMPGSNRMHTPGSTRNTSSDSMLPAHMAYVNDTAFIGTHHDSHRSSCAPSPSYDSGSSYSSSDSSSCSSSSSSDSGGGSSCGGCD